MFKCALSLSILILAVPLIAAPPDSSEEFKMGLTEMSRHSWNDAIRHFSYVEKSHPKYTRAQEMIRQAQDHKINDPKKEKIAAAKAAKQARENAAHQPIPLTFDQFWKKLEGSRNIFAAVGLRQYGVKGSILYFQADRTWRILPYDQKEKFLTTMLGSWKAVNSVGRVEIRDYYNGRVIGKAGVWGITVEE